MMRTSFVWISLVIAAMTVSLCGCISPQVPPVALKIEYPITVNYDRTVGDSLSAGHYKWAYHEISARNFSSSESGTKSLQAVLVKLNSYTAVPEIVKEQAKMGLTPATLGELLAFGEAYPDVQSAVSVIALGSYSDLYESYFVYNRHTMQMMSVRSLERLYPYLSTNIFGRMANMMESELVPTYHNPGLYGLFIKPQP